MTVYNHIAIGGSLAFTMDILFSISCYSVSAHHVPITLIVNFCNSVALFVMKIKLKYINSFSFKVKRKNILNPKTVGQISWWTYYRKLREKRLYYS